ncbi:hypothetical protein DACRYDRAFT_23085 [Dacryopinax primogenitus]|uniref:Uncharacterized protein n=1 Tax=Dacryopinax primogenitus (strain DJM 731) TaxID=1858805 RepID=M5FT42_DACPD|nr:uncharacterized protein DACRYDRAFT_23085 [Dacryopinax primogenitus]EJU00731.1 hypothetical protein DACRYDRAFT_23085 [Dacryopinax primogenitus]
MGSWILEIGGQEILKRNAEGRSLPRVDQCLMHVFGHDIMPYEFGYPAGLNVWVVARVGASDIPLRQLLWSRAFVAADSPGRDIASTLLQCISKRDSCKFVPGK